MRIKILLIGDDPASLVADRRLLRERGLLVYAAFNPQNIPEIVAEIRPDVVFFDPSVPNNYITDAYNDFVTDLSFLSTPVIFTLSEDDIYLVTRKRTDSKNKRTAITGDIITAIKSALETNKTYHGKSHKFNTSVMVVPKIGLSA